MDSYLIASEKQIKEIESAYRRAEQYANDEIDNVFRNLAKISDEKTALRAIKKIPGESVLATLKKQIKTMPKGKEKQIALTELSSPAYKARIDRLQATIDNSRKYCNELYKTELKSTNKLLLDTAEAAYYKTLFDITTGVEFVTSYSLFPRSRIDEILKENWSGKHFSKRIWGNTQNLADELKETLLSGFMSGQSTNKMADSISKKFEASVYNSRRLIRTEVNHVANAAEMESYKSCGIEQYEYVATLDVKTSLMCQELDGKIFDVKDGQSGINMPPMHPHCRSTTIAHFEERSKIEKRAAKDKDGKNIRVPGNMTYADWKKEYIDGKEEKQ